MRERESTTRSNQRVRYAVVGLGHIAQTAMLPAFAHATKNSELTALISSDPGKLETLGNQYGVPVRGRYDQYEQCLEEADAVYIALPNSMHAEYAIRAAHAGVHVLCEKPLAVTRRECLEMIRACREAHVLGMTAYRLHFERLTLWVLDQVRSGTIGDLRYLTCAFSMRAKPGGIRTEAAMGGGTLYDIGVYCINAARMLFGSEPYEAYASSIEGSRAGMPGVDETTASVLRFEGDRLATFVTSFDASDVSSMRLVGTQGDIRMQPAFKYAEPLACELTVDGETTKKRGKRGDQFAPQLLYFSECILKNRQPEPSFEEGAQDVRIVEALYESSRSGAPVTLPAFEGDTPPTRDQAIFRPPVRKPREVNTESPKQT
jgi:predicted dehydrogenase